MAYLLLNQSANVSGCFYSFVKVQNYAISDTMFSSFAWRATKKLLSFVVRNNNGEVRSDFVFLQIKLQMLQTTGNAFAHCHLSYSFGTGYICFAKPMKKVCIDSLGLLVRQA